jgi:hypothetical protein
MACIIGPFSKSEAGDLSGEPDEEIRMMFSPKLPFLLGYV